MARHDHSRGEGKNFAHRLAMPGNTAKILRMRSLVAILIASTFTAMGEDTISPVVHPDKTVTFRLKAPEAKEVSIQSTAFATQPLVKGDNGVWTYTSPALAPEIYNYVFLMDGEEVVDPANGDRQNTIFGTLNLFAIPGAADASWEPRDVPHGKIVRHPYRSEVASHDREMLVYTPPGYDVKAETPYPVLYLFHGFSDLADAWTTVGRAQVILDNLIADKKAVPMVVVMPLGYGEMSVIANGWEGRNKNGAWQKNLDGFDKALLQEVLPLAETNYHIRKEAAGRAVAGLSMGGVQALQSGLLHPDQFSWVGAFSSGGVPGDLDSAYPEVGKQPLKLLWISCGRDDSLIGANRALAAWLEKKGIPHTWTETEGAHTWPVWRRNLATFLPLLFQDK
jgi:enterochelin esterase-like enzyme